MAKNLFDIDVAMRRLAYLVKRKGNVDDREAYNSIVRFLKATQERQTEKYPLLSRMFCALFIGSYFKELEQAEKQGRKPSPKYILTTVHELATKSLEDYIDDMADWIKTMRLDIAYKDYNEALREANRIAEANKIPAEESVTLKDQYQWEDVVRVIKAKRKRADELFNDCIVELTKEYSREDIAYFIKSEITKMTMLCR